MIHWNWQRFIHITVPALKPGFMLVMLYETMMSIRHFDLFFILTEGGPADASHVLAWEVYAETFRKLAFGTGARILWLLHALAERKVPNRLARRWAR